MGVFYHKRQKLPLSLMDGTNTYTVMVLVLSLRDCCADCQLDFGLFQDIAAVLTRLFVFSVSNSDTSRRLWVAPSILDRDAEVDSQILILARCPELNASVRPKLSLLLHWCPGIPNDRLCVSVRGVRRPDTSTTKYPPADL